MSEQVVVDEAREGGRPRRGAPPASLVSRGIPPADLKDPLMLLDGIVRDLRSWNPRMHAPNPALWAHITSRAEVLLRQLQGMVVAADGE